MLGVLSPEDAIQAAYEAGLDLVEVSPNAEPPVCKIWTTASLNTKPRRKGEARKKQKVIDVKEIKMRPGIDETTTRPR